MGKTALKDAAQNCQSFKYIQNTLTQTHSQYSNTTQALNQRNTKREMSLID